MEIKTEKNLQEAFAGESQANRRYLFFAEKAEKEGHPRIARLFRAAAESETVHARNHLRAMGGIKSTKENLEAAAIREYWPLPSHEAMQTAHPLDNGGAWTQAEMVGVAQEHRYPGLGKVFGHESLHGCLCADGHEDRGGNDAVRRHDLAAARVSIRPEQPEFHYRPPFRSEKTPFTSRF